MAKNLFLTITFNLSFKPLTLLRMPSTPKYTAAPIPAQITSATTIIPMILPIELSSSLFKVFLTVIEQIALEILGQGSKNR